MYTYMLDLAGCDVKDTRPLRLPFLHHLFLCQTRCSGPEPLPLLALEELLEDGLPIAECGSVFHFLLMALGKVRTIPCTTHA